jgi:hypothetical protein
MDAQKKKHENMGGWEITRAACYVLPPLFNQKHHARLCWYLDGARKVLTCGSR